MHDRTVQKRVHHPSGRHTSAREPGTARSLSAVREPDPDTRLGELADHAGAPRARYDERESRSPTFVAALQNLSARRRAVFVLRDVLGFGAGDVAEIVDLRPADVDTALHEARAAFACLVPAPGRPAADDPVVALRRDAGP